MTGSKSTINIVTSLNRGINSINIIQDFNVPSVLILSTMIAVMSCLAMVFLYFGNREEPSLKQGAIAHSLLCAGMFCFITRNTTSAWLGIVLANTLLITSVAHLLVYVRFLFRKRIQYSHSVLVFFTTLLFFSYFTIFQDRIKIRTIYYSVIMGLLLLVIAREFSRKNPEEIWAGPRIMGVFIYGASGTVQVVRGVFIFFQMEPVGIFAEGYLNLAQFILLSLTQFFGPLVYALVIDQRSQAYEKKISLTDPLTEALNRRGFDHAFHREFSRFLRSESTFGLMIMDIDDFKTINDRYGHFCGDKVLKNLVITIANFLRKEDVLGRIGGEEFAVILPDVTMQETCQIAERIRKTVENSYVIDGNETVRFTISVGACLVNHMMKTQEDLFKIADTRLYLAKKAGKNQVVCEDSAFPAI